VSGPGSDSALWIWLVPALFAFFSYGLGQGLVKKWVGDVSPAKFCFYFVVAKAIVNLGYFSLQEHPSLLEPEGQSFLMMGTLAYLFDGLGWVLYFESIVLGPITIVGTLSAAYPALTVLLAAQFLGESLEILQYAGVALVILGCIGLSFDFSSDRQEVGPPSGAARPRNRRWMILAGAALIVWAVAQTLVKAAYSLPGSSDATLAVCSSVGGFLTLGVYAFYRERFALIRSIGSIQQAGRTLLPMGLMASGDLGVIIANQFGPLSLVTPITGAYPVVTLLFAAFILRETIHRLHWLMLALVLVGMALATWIIPSS
jgi:drug/metabolite transporter (DMT)-like permease